MTEGNRLSDSLLALPPREFLRFIRGASPKSGFDRYLLLEDPWRIRVGETLYEFFEWRERFVRGFVTLKNSPPLYKLLRLASGVPTDEEIRLQNEHRATIATEQAAQEAVKGNALALEANQFAKEANSMSREANDIAKEANAKSDTANRTANRSWWISAVVAALLVIETVFLIATYRRG
jgi:hypothetical protein